MNKLETGSLDEIMEDLLYRMEYETRNMRRVKKFYYDEVSFSYLMNQLILKDVKRFEKLIAGEKNLPNPWRILYTIIDIVQYEGKEVSPFDTLTKMLPSRTIMYYGWTFSWVHGEGTLISIFNREDELVYRF
jgi:hypothetical protein